MRTATATLAILSALIFSTVAVQAAPIDRTDLTNVWQKQICSTDFSGEPAAFWQAGVFDAQVEGRILEPPTDRNITKEMVASKAKSMANIHRHRGYTSGICDNGNAWMVSTPAPAPLRSVKNGVKLPYAEMKENCREIRARFLPRERPSATHHLSPCGGP